MCCSVFALTSFFYQEVNSYLSFIEKILKGSFYFYFTAPLASRCYSHGKVETDEEFDSRWVTYFSKPDIDAWELRKGD